MKNIESKIIRVTKIRNVDEPYHKNSDFGESKPFHEGVYFGDPVIGERFNALGAISTSPVAKIISENIFETLNSVYKWEFI